MTILFLVAAAVPLLAKRLRLRKAAVIAYLCALVLAAAYIGLWLIHPPD